MIPTISLHIPGIREIKNHVSGVLCNQEPRHVARGRNDRSGRDQNFVLILLKQDEAHNHPALVRFRNQAVESRNPCGLERAVGMVRADQGAGPAVQIRAASARDAVDLRRIPRVRALQTDDDATDAVLLIDIELRDETARVLVGIEHLLGQPLVIEQPLRDTQHCQAAAQPLAVGRASVGLRPFRASGVSNIEAVLFIARTQHRSRRDLQRSRRPDYKRREEKSGYTHTDGRKNTEKGNGGQFVETVDLTMSDSRRCLSRNTVRLCASARRRGSRKADFARLCEAGMPVRSTQPSCGQKVRCREVRSTNCGTKP